MLFFFFLFLQPPHKLHVGLCVGPKMTQKIAAVKEDK